MSDDIKTKQQFIDKWLNGEFGNRVEAWRTLEETLQSGKSPIAIRFKSLSANSIYGIRRDDLAARVQQLEDEGIHNNDLYFNEAAPDKALLLQGEYWTGIPNHYLLFSARQAPMKQALQFKNLESQGLSARMLLQRHMTPSSFEDFMELADKYKDHVIEFGIYTRNVGFIPNRNVLIWEVRKY